ncbi:hypothetical protein [Streptomyces sp. NPDC005423]|uniref:hypothetical protein n=1 Tax=Streptomyces sp. NPDC005423 TaxID=3155343 RepID=UPI0033BE32F5
MQARGRRLRFTAVLALVVLTLTGFSTGRHRGTSRHSGGGGGGCSSSGQDHDTSTSSGGTSGGGSSTRRPNYRSTPTSTPTSATSSGSGLLDGTARLVSCATATKRYATVEVSNPNSRRAAFSVDVTFLDAQDNEVDFNYETVKVPAKGRATVRVPVLGTSTPVDHCQADSRATAGG